MVKKHRGTRKGKRVVRRTRCVRRTRRIHGGDDPLNNAIIIRENATDLEALLTKNKSPEYLQKALDLALKYPKHHIISTILWANTNNKNGTLRNGFDREKIEKALVILNDMKKPNNNNLELNNIINELNLVLERLPRLNN